MRKRGYVFNWERGGMCLRKRGMCLRKRGMCEKEGVCV